MEILRHLITGSNLTESQYLIIYLISILYLILLVIDCFLFQVLKQYLELTDFC